MNDRIETSVAKNVTVMMGAQGITWLSSFILMIFLPRYLGSQNYGRLYLAISVGMIISIIIDFGGNYLIPKEISRSKSITGDILVSYLGIRFVIWAFCMAGLVLFSIAAGYSRITVELIMILGFSQLWVGGMRAIKSTFQGHEMMEYPSVGVIVEKVFVAVFAVSSLLMGAGPIIIAVFMTLGSILDFLICYKFTSRIIKSFPRFKWSTSVNLVKGSLPYFMWAVFAVVYYRIDAVMLSIMTSSQTVGWYGGAYRFFDMVMFLPSIFTTVIYPVFSRLWDQKDNRFENSFHKSLKFIIITALPISILFFVFAPNIIDLFYGLKEYGPSVLILQVFAPGIILVYIDFILGSTIMATNRQKRWAYVGFVAMLINVAINFFLIPYAQARWGNGGIGAAMATLLTECFVLISASIMIPGSYFENFRVSDTLKCVLSGLVMAISLWYMQSAHIFWVAEALIAVTVYGLGLYFSNAFSERERAFARKFFTIRNLKNFLTQNRSET